ncbi:MAG: DinB family protein [Edaphobacter sp.]
MIGLTGEELLAWNDKTAERWRRLFEVHDDLLAVPCDIAGVKSVGELMQHIVAVELRYAERLAGLPETSYEAIEYGTGAVLFATHAQAMNLFHGLLADPTCDWAQEMEFSTRSMGVLRASRKTIFVHALMHGIRHYAQLATLARQHGVAPDWQMDYLLMGAKRA